MMIYHFEGKIYMTGKNKNFKLAIAISAITQIGISVIISVFICIYGAAWLRDKFSLGNWIVILGIVLGIGSGILSVFRQVRAFFDKTR